MFTKDQCDSFNAYQEVGVMHPFTCGNDHKGNNVLRMDIDGIRCPTCEYAQDFVHAWMIDWSWKQSPVFAAIQYLKKEK